MHTPGNNEENNPAALPFAFSTGTKDWANVSYHWTQQVLTNFIEVCTGPLARTISCAWADEDNAATIYSETMMKRPVRSSAWIVLCPPFIVLLSIIVLMILAPLSHRKAASKECV